MSIVAPVYNEREVLPQFLSRLRAVTVQLAERYLFEIIFVDDGSSDGSLAVAKELIREDDRLRVIELRRNFGQTAALQAGMDAARGSIVITMDADLQHFPEDIPIFLEKVEGGSDVVCGWRHQRREGLIRRWPSRVANAMIRAATGLTIHDIGTTFRAYRREIIRDIQLLGENHRFVPVFARKVGARLDEVKIGNIERPSGKSNYGLSRTLNVWLDLFFIYYYANYFDRPIRAFGKIAMIMFAFGGGIIGVLGTVSIVTGQSVVYRRTGWIYLAAMLLLTGTQLLLTGLLSEVLARIYYSNGPDRTAYKIRNAWTAQNLIG